MPTVVVTVCSPADGDAVRPVAPSATHGSAGSVRAPFNAVAPGFPAVAGRPRTAAPGRVSARPWPACARRSTARGGPLPGLGSPGHDVKRVSHPHRVRGLAVATTVSMNSAPSALTCVIWEVDFQPGHVLLRDRIHHDPPFGAFTRRGPRRWYRLSWDCPLLAADSGAGSSRSTSADAARRVSVAPMSSLRWLVGDRHGAGVGAVARSDDEAGWTTRTGH